MAADVAPGVMVDAGALSCPVCDTDNPALSRFCASCGNDLLTAQVAGARRRAHHYVVHPSEPVHSVSVLSTVMPHLGGARRHTYRSVVALAALVPVVAAASGALPFALVSAAVLVPLVYLVYLQDADVWERESVPVVGLAVVTSAALGTLFALAWRDWWFKWIRIPLNLTAGEIDARELLVVGLFVPVIGVVLAQIGPLILGRRPSFNHLLDGLSFGVVSGASFVAAETIVANRSLIGNVSTSITSGNAGMWVTLIVSAALIRPLFFGALIGLTVAEFVGVGQRTGAVSARYVRALVEAAGAAVVFSVGLYVCGLLRGVEGALLGAIFGLVMLALAIMRLRVRLHDALLDEAIEALSNGTSAPGHALTRAHCTNCQTPLLEGAHFCVSCGQASLASTKVVRTPPRTERPVPQPGTGTDGPTASDGPIAAETESEASL